MLSIPLGYSLVSTISPHEKLLLNALFTHKQQAATDQTWIGKYPPVQVYVSKPVLNHNNHMANGKEESSNLKRLLTYLFKTNLRHIADDSILKCCQRLTCIST